MFGTINYFSSPQQIYYFSIQFLVIFSTFSASFFRVHFFISQGELHLFRPMRTLEAGYNLLYTDEIKHSQSRSIQNVSTVLFSSALTIQFEYKQTKQTLMALPLRGLFSDNKDKNYNNKNVLSIKLKIFTKIHNSLLPFGNKLNLFHLRFQRVLKFFLTEFETKLIKLKSKRSHRIVRTPVRMNTHSVISSTIQI